MYMLLLIQPNARDYLLDSGCLFASLGFRGAIAGRRLAA